MGKGNFKARCIHKNNNPYYTEGKVYEVKDRTLIADDGHKIFTGLLWRFEDLQKFSGAEWELVKEYSGEYISIKRRKKRVVAVMSVDGQYKKSANVKLNDFDGDFEKAAKAVVDKLLSFDCKTNEKVGGNFKAKCIRTIDNVLTVGKVYEVVNGYSAFDNGKVMPNSVQDGISIFTCFEDMKKWFAVKGISEFEEVIETTFDWEAFKRGEFAVHCDTEEKAEAFLKECDEQGIRWCSGHEASSLINWKYYRENTYYRFYVLDKGIAYGDLSSGCPVEVINYAPSNPAVKASEPEPYRIVKQDKYEVGDKVKIVDEWVPESFENDEGKMDKWLGKIMTIRVVNSDYYRMEEDKTENYGTGWYWNNKCIEGKVVEDIQVNPAVKEVKRPAKVGEWIKVVDGSGHDNGTGIFKVTSLNWNNDLPDWVYVNGKSSGIIRGDQYVVLENYQPESSSLDSNPEQEQPTSSTGMREVERFAKEGDIIEVLTGDGHRAEVGGIYKVLRPWDDYGWIEVQLSPEQDTDVLRYDQYVVLENYDYSLGHPKNEPFRKAKVGDKIKVVKDISNLKYQDPTVEIGSTHVVGGADSQGIWTVNRNYFWDKHQEYIIIEEAPEEIQIGDTVKVVNNGKCYTRYEEWFVENAPQYLGKFAYGGMPKNGGSYKVLMKNDKDGLKYVIQEIGWPNDAVYLIDEKGIEKVR